MSKYQKSQGVLFQVQAGAKYMPKIIYIYSKINPVQTDSDTRPRVSLKVRNSLNEFAPNTKYCLMC